MQNVVNPTVMFGRYGRKMLDLHKDETYWPENMFLTNLSWEPILSVRCAKRKLKVTEIAGDEPGRIGGERKLQVIRWGLGYMAQVIAETVYWR